MTHALRSWPFPCSLSSIRTRLFQGLAIAAVGLPLTAINRLRMRRLERNEEMLRKRVDAAVAKVKVLGGMLPLCASCKKIRGRPGPLGSDRVLHP